MNAYHHIDVERFDQFCKFRRILETRDAAMEKIPLFYRRGYRPLRGKPAKPAVVLPGAVKSRIGDRPNLDDLMSGSAPGPNSVSRNWAGIRQEQRSDSTVPDRGTSRASGQSKYPIFAACA